MGEIGCTRFPYDLHFSLRLDGEPVGKSKCPVCSRARVIAWRPSHAESAVATARPLPQLMGQDFRKEVVGGVGQIQRPWYLAGYEGMLRTTLYDRKVHGLQRFGWQRVPCVTNVSSYDCGFDILNGIKGQEGVGEEASHSSRQTSDVHPQPPLGIVE
jgi:hypothetical protein